MAQLTLNQAKIVLAQHGITVIPKIEYDDLCARAADGHDSRGSTSDTFGARTVDHVRALFPGAPLKHPVGPAANALQRVGRSLVFT
ncbi:MAG: hypothetical protein QOC76_153 [Mycobacterium sp.]|jgi:hypothetical protein|nr:hypothetical protein [Mycobacterium sp.]